MPCLRGGLLLTRMSGVIIMEKGIITAMGIIVGKINMAVKEMEADVNESV